MDTTWRVYFNDSVFCDRKISYEYSKYYETTIYTFKKVNEDWYIKRFGKFELFLGERSFHTDSIVIHDDKPIRSDRGNMDTLTIYPLRQRYYPRKRADLGNGRVIYIYVGEMFYEGKEEEESTVFFDPRTGIIKRYSTWRESCLDGYEYFDKTPKDW